jgi:glycosyltransferase involved in cell wall biosynthesis
VNDATGVPEDPVASVIVPAYNAASTIEAAVESVLAQTRQDFEVIVVDDGSTDDTPDRVARYADDSRVRLLSQENRGLAAARNAAIEASRGTYVSLLDSDDMYFPRYLELMIDRLERNPAAAVAYPDAWVLDDEVGRVARAKASYPWHPASAPSDPALFFRALLELGNFVFIGATIRCSVLAAVGVFRGGIQGSEDYELWLRIAAHGYPFVRVPMPLAIKRRGPGHMTARLEEMERAANEVFRIVADEYHVSAELRDVARQRLPMRRFPARSPRRVPAILSGPYRILSRMRHYHLRPPREIRRAFPDRGVVR